MNMSTNNFMNEVTYAIKTTIRNNACARPILLQSSFLLYTWSK